MVLTKTEVEEAIKNDGDFVKIDHLNRFLKKADSLDVKKYIHLRLAGIYDAKNFISDAAKNIDAAADSSLTFKEKIELYMKEAELFVRAGQFDSADKAFQKAFFHANLVEREQIKEKYLEFYRSQAKINEKAGKQRIAAQVYEKLISLPQPEERRIEVKNTLLGIYERLGRLRDFNMLKNREF